MDHDALAALFRRIVLASAPLLAGGCFIGEDHQCNSPERELTTPVIIETDAGPSDAGVTDLCRQALPPNPDSFFVKKCELVAADGGQAVHVVYAQKCVGGRRPEGLTSPMLAARRDPLAAWLAGCAHLEAASIDAFEVLAAELTAHRGPRPLIASARAAARDERRHAAVIGRLAARRGHRTPAARVSRSATRDIETIARENAVEGCVRETYAALLAGRQAFTAADPAIRAAMIGIARDETGHAALAWAVDAWADGQLSRSARRRVREARQEAGDALLAGQTATLPPALRAQAGLPDADEAAQMVAMLRAGLPS
jgi:hypothetical protein